MGSKMEPSFNKIQEQLPEIMKAFNQLRQAASQEGALSARVKHIIFIAVAVALRCEPCIRVHIRKAVEMGISRKEILEAVGIAIVMAGGPAVAYSSTVIEVLDEMNASVDTITTMDT
ncbi:MAG: carboxymuconolactone decarboxylase family protein [bacterium]